MILRRLGNKNKIASDIIQHFPPHRNYIELFFGAGGIFFNKRLAEHNFLNDIDSEVFNLFQIIRFKKSELVNAVEIMPIHENLFSHWKVNNETDDVWRAARFLMLSNMSYMGKCDTLHQRTNNKPKPNILHKIEETFLKIKDVRFLCTDFRKVITKIVFECGKDRQRDLDNTFIYADPPYLGQTHTYQEGFKEKDTIDLFDVCANSGIPFAISEFDNPIVLELAKTHNLEVITIGDRKNLKNRRTEIMCVNYPSPALHSLFRNQEQSLLMV